MKAHWVKFDGLLSLFDTELLLSEKILHCEVQSTKAVLLRKLVTLAQKGFCQSLVLGNVIMFIGGEKEKVMEKIENNGTRESSKEG